MFNTSQRPYRVLVNLQSVAHLCLAKTWEQGGADAWQEKGCAGFATFQLSAVLADHSILLCPLQKLLLEYERVQEHRSMQARARTYQNIQTLQSSRPLVGRFSTPRRNHSHIPVVQAALENLANDPNLGRNPSRARVYFLACPPPKLSEKSIQITYPADLEEVSLCAVARKIRGQKWDRKKRRQHTSTICGFVSWLLDVVLSASTAISNRVLNDGGGSSLILLKSPN